MLLTLGWQAKAATAQMITQKNYIVTNGPPVGTAAMMNCLGLIIHDKRTDFGALAHIEAQATEPAYLKDIGLFFKRMLANLDKLSGSSNSQLEVVLAGNGSGGEWDALGGLLIDTAALRLPSTNIADNRSKVTAAQAIGKGPRCVDGKAAGAMIYNPKTREVLFAVDPKLIKDVDAKGTKVVQVQK